MKITNSKRLNFALMTSNDAQLLFDLDQDAEVMRYINGGKISSMQEIRDIYIPRMQSYTNEPLGWGLWKVEVTQTNEFIGWVLVRPMDFFTDHPQYNNLELGWRFMQKAWGKGYATEAAQSITRAIAEQTQVKYFSAIAMEDNAGSINIMKKLGMAFLKKELHQDPLGDMEAVYYQTNASSPGYKG
ncbi:GNAT family N-acetyltransferase [Thalassomonas haliotis]|uniref:GNAT family N-acetyltransferase n=1 Tax=Thalassomonas haliotis TaxID=485448 RepID=A0ABY7VK77_9GAMM|nr:GNAT family N-acetyltransferase [Thalassomonas haliotis]WDE14147.1 GNAT family N-acetyltransferase [Thalassomonas haliotis]